MSLDAQERELFAAMQAVALADQIAQLRTALGKAIVRVQRRQIAIQADIDRATEVDTIRMHGSMLLAHLKDIVRGAPSFQYENESSTLVDVPLNPAKSARENADMLFVKARKIETGARIAMERLLAADTELERLRVLIAKLDNMQSPDEIDLAIIEARKLKVPLPAPQGPAAAGPKKKTLARVPYRRFETTNERVILVGKGAADNDDLTLHHARPQDLWLHARDITGAHVVVPLQKGETCPAELLVDAATLAAHFSDARGEDRVDVAYTQKRFVRKPKGSPKGSVEVMREKVFVVRIEKARLERLLASETLPQ